MPEIIHFPRISGRQARIVLRQLSADPLLLRVPWTDRRALPGAASTFAASGGRRVTDAELTALRDRIIALATAAGFGGPRVGDFRAFDASLAIALLEEDLVPPPEALRDDVWAFLATILAPDVVSWRFGGTAERYAGGVRNAFQR